jgi:hypothetical protein
MNRPRTIIPPSHRTDIDTATFSGVRRMGDVPSGASHPQRLSTPDVSGSRAPVRRRPGRAAPGID